MTEVVARVRRTTKVSRVRPPFPDYSLLALSGFVRTIGQLHIGASARRVGSNEGDSQYPSQQESRVGVEKPVV
jgi:hypothetical protein